MSMCVFASAHPHAIGASEHHREEVSRVCESVHEEDVLVQ